MIVILKKILRPQHFSLIRLQCGFNSSPWISSGKNLLFVISILKMFSIASTSNEIKTDSNTVQSLEKSSSWESNTMQSNSIDDTIDFFQTPKKYRRRPITQDEIDLLAV